MADGTLNSLVRAAYADMAPAERRVADLILYFPGELHGYTASELARLSGTSNAAVTRFVRRLGFANYEEMRLFVRDESESGSPVSLIRLNASDDGSKPYDLLAHSEITHENVTSTINGIDPDVWEKLVDAAMNAPRIWIVGFRHSHFLAAYLSWSLRHVREGVELLPKVGETFGESLVDVRENDLAIVFAIRRRVPDIGQLANVLKQSGSRLALITDIGLVDTMGADVVLRCHTRFHGALDDHTSALVLSHALIESLIHSIGDSARRRFLTIDEHHAKLAEFG